MQKFVYRKDTKGLLVPFNLVCVGRRSNGGVAPHTNIVDRNTRYKQKFNYTCPYTCTREINPRSSKDSAGPSGRAV
jgi:hypothetical protein